MSTSEPSTLPQPSHRVIFAPQPYAIRGATVFLSGSIDATWQSEFAASLSHHPITILNPHRPDWDSTWREEITFPPFHEQVNWELDGMEKADVIAIYFGPRTQAPISLLELGLFIRSGKCVVACHEQYPKRGNVQIVCGRLSVEVLDSVGHLGVRVVELLRKKGVLGD